ncbi:hypothetical protein DNTS_031183 [Danionella cerebrum]|uniref:Cytochrome P450 n=1 Tax=Danionella cerebrum TaxID=2873325 RepID=A0A553RPA4_9TELE|nr:hypothetical protein DNTS_031183 [Danionella translucida]
MTSVHTLYGNPHIVKPSSNSSCGDIRVIERFLSVSGGKLTPACFLPFGAGPRVCVGESLARIELFLFTARLLQRFRFSKVAGKPLPDLSGRLGVVLQPEKFSVSIIPRG